jgi:hypothetical protein
VVVFGAARFGFRVAVGISLSASLWSLSRCGGVDVVDTRVGMAGGDVYVVHVAAGTGGSLPGFG